MDDVKLLKHVEHSKYDCREEQKSPHVLRRTRDPKLFECRLRARQNKPNPDLSQCDAESHREDMQAELLAFLVSGLIFFFFLTHVVIACNNFLPPSFVPRTVSDCIIQSVLLAVVAEDLSLVFDVFSRYQIDSVVIFIVRMEIQLGIVAETSTGLV